MPSLWSGITSGHGLCICPHRNFSQLVRRYYCPIACLYAKCCNLIGWITGTWTIYTFPYRRSGPFIRFSIKVKTQDFWEDDRETINRSNEKLVTFWKLSLNFWKLTGKTWNDRLLHFKQNFPSIYIPTHTFPSMFWIFQPGNKLLNNWLDYLYEKYKSLSCGRFIRQDLGLYIFPYRYSNQLLRR